MWNFEAIKKKRRATYTIHPLEDQSVRNHWKLGSDEVVVTMANHVGLQKRRN
jgi:hypothetical protein